jgi:hypothetical protein
MNIPRLTQAAPERHTWRLCLYIELQGDGAFLLSRTFMWFFVFLVVFYSGTF